MQFPTYLLSHHVIRHTSTVDSSFPAPQHLRLLPVLGISLIPWVLGRSRGHFPSTEAKRKQVCVCVFISFPGSQGSSLDAGLRHLDASPRNFISGASGTKTGGWPEMITGTGFGVWQQQHQPQVVTRHSLGQSRGWLLSCPVYLGSCPFPTPGSLAFLLILWTIQYPFNNFLFLSLPELVPTYL